RGVRRFEGGTGLGGAPARRLALRRGVPVALPQPTHPRPRDAGCGMRDADTMAGEQPPRGVREPRRPPAICDDGRCYPHRDDPRRPAKRGHREGHAGGGGARAQGEDDRVRGLGHLCGELQPREHVSSHRSRVSPTAGNPAARPERPGTPPGAQDGEGEGRRAARADDQRRPASTRRRHGAARDRVRLAELSEHGAVSQGRSVDRRAETGCGAGAARRDEHGSRADARQQELQPAHFVAAARRGGPVFALEAEPGHTERAGEGRRRLERRGPRAQATRLERRAYLFAQQRRIKHLAPDPEAASFHRYHDRIFLVQLASPSLTAIIDPLAIADLSPVGGLLDDPKVEKIFHDADYDLRILDRDYGFRARRLFDTRIAAQLAGEPAVGLAALLEKYAGVKLAKEHQKADWSRRPLSAAMLAYAAADTAHLPALREQLRARLTALGRLAWAEEEFARLEDL